MISWSVNVFRSLNKMLIFLLLIWLPNNYVHMGPYNHRSFPQNSTKFNLTVRGTSVCVTVWGFKHQPQRSVAYRPLHNGFSRFSDTVIQALSIKKFTPISADFRYVLNSLPLRDCYGRFRCSSGAENKSKNFTIIISGSRYVRITRYFLPILKTLVLCPIWSIFLLDIW